jgi:Domain of unknown function (DUF4389)
VTASAAPIASGSYPLGLSVTSPSSVERWRPLVNWLLVIPHEIWAFVLLLGAEILAFLGWFSILFTGRLPDSWSDYMVGVLRYQWRIASYLYAWTLEYPTFSPVPGHIDPGDYPAVLWCARAVERDRLTTFFRGLLVIPHLIVLYLFGIVALVALVAAWFVVLFTGRWPEGLRQFVTGFFRWQFRVTGYYLLLTDAYPPFDTTP